MIHTLDIARCGKPVCGYSLLRLLLLADLG